jgi:hypothetical protein
MAEETPTRFTFNATPKARRAMEGLLALEFGTNQTEVMNRALIMAFWIMEEADRGAEIKLVRQTEVVFL